MVGEFFIRANRLWRAYEKTADEYAKTVHGREFSIPHWERAYAARKRVPAWLVKRKQSGLYGHKPYYDVNWRGDYGYNSPAAIAERRRKAMDRRRRKYFFRHIYDENLPYRWQDRERPRWWNNK